MKITTAVGPPEDGARRSPSTLGSAETQAYPARLHHETPAWVVPGGVFHVRVRCDRENRVALTEPAVATALLDSVAFYSDRHRWWPSLFLLMPDHLHALLSFPPTESMSVVVGDWKRYQQSQYGVVWQEGYFDHRIRNQHEFELKAAYIRRNPVAAGLCNRPEDWPWVRPKHAPGEAD